MYRPRRIRKTEAIRGLVRETHVPLDSLVMPYFVLSGKNRKEPVRSMPGIYRMSADNIIKDIANKAVLLFAVPDIKDYKKDKTMENGIKALRKEFRDLVIFADVCLCAYTRSGHCFIEDNDRTVKILSEIAVSYADTGVSFVAPSGMMDGQVYAIRTALDKRGFTDIGIMAYSAKYASGFYGPFRDALDSAPRKGDRKGYQMDFANAREAVKEAELDIREGADIVMVKPALAYLDIIYRVKQRVNVPVAAYNVSGEYTMLRTFPAGMGIVKEVLTSIKRAGADIIITYYARELAERGM